MHTVFPALRSKSAIATRKPARFGLATSTSRRGCEKGENLDSWCRVMSRTAILLWLGSLAACFALCAGGGQMRLVELPSLQQGGKAPALQRNWIMSLRGGGDEGDEGAEGEEAEGDGAEEEEEEDAGPMTINKALKQVLYYSRIHLGLARGVKEVIQALLRGEAQLVVLAEDCDEGKYVETVEALAADKGVYLLKVPEREQLGEWAGQVKLDDDGKPRKVCGTSSVAVKDFGEQSEGLAFLLDYIKSMSAGEGEQEAGDEAE